MLALAGILAFRGLSPTAMGDLTLTVAWATFLRMVCGGGVPLILRRDFKSGTAESQTLLRDGTAIVVRMWLLALLIGIPLAWGLAGRSLAVIFLLVAIHHFFGTLLDCYRATQVAQGNARGAAVIDLGNGVLLLAFSAAAFAFSRSTVVAFAIAYAVSGMLSLPLAGLTVGGLQRPTWILSRGAPVLALGSLPFLVEALVVNGYFRLSTNVVYVLDSPATSGIFSTAQGLALLLGVIPSTIGSAALPRIVSAAQESSAALWEEVKRLWFTTIPLGAVLIAVVAGSAAFWIPVALGPKGRDVVPHFVLFAVSRFAVFVSVPPLFALDAMRLQRRRVVVAVGAAITTLAIGLPATRTFGGLGMTWTLSVLEFGVAATYVVFLLRALRRWKPVRLNDGNP